MKFIRLTNSGIRVFVDDDDHGYLSEHTWHLSKNGYVSRSYWKPNQTNGTIYMHRLIMDAPKGMDVDHKDLNRFNNQKSNLRIATRSQNMANTPSRSGHSKYKGVSRLNRPNMKKPWLSYIRVEGKMYYNGYYETQEEAAHIYNQFAEQIFGEFAYLNEIEGGNVVKS